MPDPYRVATGWMRSSAKRMGPSQALLLQRPPLKRSPSRMELVGAQVDARASDPWFASGVSQVADGQVVTHVDGGRSRREPIGAGPLATDEARVFGEQGADHVAGTGHRGPIGRIDEVVRQADVVHPIVQAQ